MVVMSAQPVQAEYGGIDFKIVFFVVVIGICLFLAGRYFLKNKRKCEVVEDMGTKVRKMFLLFVVAIVAIGGLIAGTDKKEREEYRTVQSEISEETDVPEETVTPKITGEPHTISLGLGNTAAALLKGGYFVCKDSTLYMADGQYIYTRNHFEEVEQLVYSTEGDIGYLCICGDYLYYMTDVDRDSIGYPRDDRNIYRICLLYDSEPELVVSGVTDFGTGYGIRSGKLYCTVRERISPSKYQYILRCINLNDMKVLSEEENIRFFAITDSGIFQVNSNHDLVFVYSGGEYTISNVGDWWISLPMYRNKWTFSIEEDSFYYIDIVKQDSPCIMRVSPKGVTVFEDIGTVGADYGTDLYAVDGEVILDIGTIVSRWGYGSDDYYSHTQYAMANGSGNLYDYSDIEGNELLYITDGLIIYRSGGDVYWSNHMKYNFFAPAGMDEDWGILLETDNTGIEPFDMPTGMKFSVE